MRRTVLKMWNTHYSGRVSYETLTFGKMSSPTALRYSIQNGRDAGALGEISGAPFASPLTDVDPAAVDSSASI